MHGQLSNGQLVGQGDLHQVLQGAWDKHEFHWEAGLGLGFKNHKMVHPGSIPLRTGRQPDHNTGLHLTLPFSVPVTHLTRYQPYNRGAT